MSLDLSPALEILRRSLPSLAGVYLFGSHALRAARPESDIDFAFFAGRSAGGAEVLALRERIAQALLREVDLVDLAGASTILQMQILGDGVLLAAPDAKALGLFELRVMRDYRELKRRRSGIEADIARRGRVHA